MQSIPSLSLFNFQIYKGIFYVHKDADLERASNNFIYGKTITGGQRCSSIQEAIIDAPVYEKFIEAVLKKVKNIVTGPGYSKEVMDADAAPGKWSLPPVADEEQYDHIKDLLDRAVKAGGKIRYQDKLPKSLTDKGYFFPLQSHAQVPDTYSHCFWTHKTFH